MIPGYFIIKVAGHCNLSCNYCFAEPSFTGSLMEIEVLFEALRQIDDLGIVGPKIGWHGGEPTMYGIEAMRKGLEFQTTLESQFCNGLQTNATLINQDWIDLFKEHQVSVGVSLDGPEDVHNRNRPFRNGLGSFSQTKKGLDLLLANGLSVGIISVISRYADPESYFQFVKDIGVSSFDMKPCMSEWFGGISLQEFTEFQARVFELWLENDDPQLTSRTFAGYTENCLGGKGSLCLLSGNCSNFVAIDTNGDVYPCDELLRPEFRMGNLLESPLKEIFASPIRQKFECMVNDHLSACEKECADFQTCRGGCTSGRLHYGSDEYCRHLSSTSKVVKAWIESTEDDAGTEYIPACTPEQDNMFLDTSRYINIGQGHGSLQTRYALGGIEAVHDCVQEIEEARSMDLHGTTSNGEVDFH